MATAADRGWGPGWPTARYSDMVTIVVGDRAKVKLSVHKRIAPIFKQFCDEIDRRGYDLEAVADDWGYACRPIRGTQTPSNHSWGLAIDLNAVANPMSSTLITDMPAWVIDLAEKKYGLFWGGRYRTRPDAMHFEFLGTPADADRVIARLTVAPSVPVAVPATPDGAFRAPIPIMELDLMAVAKDTLDAQKAQVRTWFQDHLLRSPNNQAELDEHVLRLARDGADPALTFILDSAEGKAVRAAKRRAVGL